MAELFAAARGSFETLSRRCEAGAGDGERTQTVRAALSSHKATDLAAALRGDGPDETK
jgi:hypothetical protein